MKTQLDNMLRDDNGINLIMKNNNEAPQKNKKKFNCRKSDFTLILYLNKFIDQYQIQEIDTFFKRENLSSEILKIAISLL